jgi:hypothetical protein
MENELLKKMKLDVEDTKYLVTTHLDEINYLEHNPIVKRYRKLLHLKYELDHGLRLKTDDEIIRYEYWKYTQGIIQQTNEIYFLIGVYDSKKYFELTKLKIDENSEVLVYLNLENEQMHIAISLEEQENFESTHNVIKSLSDTQYIMGEYYKIREEFFVDCVNSGQDVAVKKILSKNKK